MAPAPGLFVARCWIAFFARDRAAEVTLEGAAHELLAATRRPVSPRSAAPAWVSTVRDYLHANFRAPVGLRDLAAFAKVHEVHVVRGFRRSIGVTPGVYLRRLRLDAARHALVATSDPIAAARGAAAGEDAALARRVDAYTRPLLERGDLSGQLLVARRGRIVLERSYGFADREFGVVVTPDTRFNIASITKPMTVIATIGLIQEGRLSPSDSIARWIPDFPKADSIRVTHLLNHRSGIPHEAMPDSGMTQPLTAAGVVEILKHRPLEFPVGSRESYSSGGFEVLAHGLENAPFQDFSGLVGAGSVWSTARDLHALVQAIVAGRMVRGAKESYVRRGHLDFNGRTGGFKAWALWDSAGAVEVVFLSNRASGAPDLLKREALALVRGDPVPPIEFPALSREPLPDAEQRGWEGDYQIENGGPHLHLRAQGGALYSNDWVLLPTTDGAMFSPRDYGLVRAIRGPDGRVVNLDWQQGQDHYEAPGVGAP